MDPKELSKDNNNCDIAIKIDIRNNLIPGN